MACAGAAGATEAAVVAVLGAQEVTFTIDGSNLTLMSGANGLQYSAAMDLPLREGCRVDRGLRASAPEVAVRVICARS